MSSTKALLCDFCIILVVGLAVVYAEEAPRPVADEELLNTTEIVPKGNCTCGGFPSIMIESGSQPLLSQMPGLEVKCDDDGESTCKQLCIALATAAKAKGPEVLCVRLKNAEELKLSAFCKVCDRPWMYADMTADEPLCCRDSQVKVCASVQQANTTDVDDVKTAL